MKTRRSTLNPAFIISLTSVHTVFFKSLLILSMVILIVPVVQGCIEHPQDSDFTEAASMPSVKVAVRQLSDTQTRCIDAFVFNDDQLQRLDCYQSMENLQDRDILVGSRSGNKILLLCANLHHEKDSWREYNSFKKAGAMKVNLEDEDRNYPVMASYAHFQTGRDTRIDMERLSSEVELHSINCDFKGKPYAGEKITDAKAYLINVNGTCSLLPQENEGIERVINHGGLIESDMTNLKDPTLLLSELGEIGTEVTYPSCQFLCYVNKSPEESLGSPYTRLVIEGKIQGETWYWPIDINRDGSANGIERNSRYIFNITLTSKGTKNPNAPVKTDMTDITFKAETWKEKEEYCVSF